MARSVRAYSIGISTSLISTKDIDNKLSSQYNLEMYFTIPIQCHFRFFFSVNASLIYWVDKKKHEAKSFIESPKIFGISKYFFELSKWFWTKHTKLFSFKLAMYGLPDIFNFAKPLPYHIFT